jgi:hypothetical protein
VKLANYDDPRLIGNELRIRYSDLAAQWDRQDLDEGFEPDYVVRPVAGPIITLEIEQGRFDDEFWELVPADG